MDHLNDPRQLTTPEIGSKIACFTLLFPRPKLPHRPITSTCEFWAGNACSAKVPEKVIFDKTGSSRAGECCLTLRNFPFPVKS